MARRPFRSPYEILRAGVLDPARAPDDDEWQHVVSLLRDLMPLWGDDWDDETLRWLAGLLTDRMADMIRAFAAGDKPLFVGVPGPTPESLLFPGCPAAEDGVGYLREFTGYVYRCVFGGMRRDLPDDLRYRILAAVSGNAAVYDALICPRDARLVDDYRSAAKAANDAFIAELQKVSVARGTPGIALVVLPTHSCMEGVVDALKDQASHPDEFDFGDFAKRRRLA